MGEIGKALRLSRILQEDGRAVIVAFDHGIVYGALLGSERAGEVLKKIVAGGADGVLMTTGLLKQHYSLLAGRIAVLWSIPFDPGYVEVAARLGVEGVKTTYFGDVGDDVDLSMMEQVALACEEWGIPYMCEIVPARREAGKIVVRNEPELVGVAVRRGYELGGDMIKTAFTGRDSFQHIVGLVDVPVLILGGAKGDERAALKMARDAVEVGGAGIVFGRNVWQHPDPQGMVEALTAIVHDGEPVERALKRVRH